MTPKDNLNRYIYNQISLWAGIPLEIEVPKAYKELISGRSEANLDFYDCRGNKDFQHNPLFWSGQILEPIINQWLKEHINKNHMTDSTLWPEGKDFAVCLTHDVDFAGNSILSGRVRQVKMAFRSGHIDSKWAEKLIIRLAALGRDFLGIFKGTEKCSIFDSLLELEDQYAFRSTFFFFPDTPHRYDERDGTGYRHNDLVNLAGQRITIAEVMKEIDRQGWEVGGTWHI